MGAFEEACNAGTMTEISMLLKHAERRKHSEKVFKGTKIDHIHEIVNVKYIVHSLIQLAKSSHKKNKNKQTNKLQE